MKVVNKYFNDDISTKMSSRSKHGEKYIERIIEASISEHIKEVMIKNKEKKNVKREELNLSRNIGINKNIVDSLFYIEKYDSLVDVEFNSSNSFMNINKNDTYVDLLSLYGVVNSKKYNEKYKVTQVNFDAFDRFHDNEGVYVILENEYHTKRYMKILISKFILILHIFTIRYIMELEKKNTINYCI